MAARRFRLEPLAEMSGLSISALGRVLHISGTQWKKARDEGVGEVAADRYSTRLGFNPGAVWAEWYDLAIASVSIVCDNCRVWFVPVNQQQRFCSAPCKKRAWARRKYATDPIYAATCKARAAAYYDECRPYVRARQTRQRAA